MLHTGLSNLLDTLLVGEIFSASRCHTYMTVFEPFNFSQKARCQTYRTLLTRKLSYKYDIEKRKKSLSQAKCPISLTTLYLNGQLKIWGQLTGLKMRLKRATY